tara:strand:+ start:740 stop:928 length:189 start_codon:yes stop_codon:yes gene_type:complete
MIMIITEPEMTASTNGKVNVVLDFTAFKNPTEDAHIKGLIKAIIDNNESDNLRKKSSHFLNK